MPGTVLAGRYRIVGLLGRGGMGEVYRADDLKLEQPVALKFLPHGLDGDGERLARFYREVRVARQVSHPAVCRVYDVAEADGHFFLSMELVDGENLASLLRRIGRLPPDKALEIARQLCAGLAAAHEKGVLHRDLKPANVMLDGQGNVRITDFGLAGLAESLRDEDVRSGTPCYMSPEQLQGREVTVRSDIYSLGLVLYELYTGRRAFEGKSLAEYTRKHRDERPIEPSALVAGLDPAVERAILALPREGAAAPAVLRRSSSPRCSPAATRSRRRSRRARRRRPSSWPRPARRDGLRPALAWGLLGRHARRPRARAARRAARFRLLEMRPGRQAAGRARGPRARLHPARGAASAPAIDDAWGLGADWGYTGHVAREGPLASAAGTTSPTGNPPVLQFWYRQSPRPLVSMQPSGKVYWIEARPRGERHGGRHLRHGGAAAALLRGPAAARARAARRPPPAPDWSPLFAEARLDPASFRAVDAALDARPSTSTRAPRGRGPGRAGPTSPSGSRPRRTAGRPAWFEIVWPWTRPERMETYAWPTAKLLQPGAVPHRWSLLLLGAAGFMARRNLVLGRGDRRGAFRVALLLARRRASSRGRSAPTTWPTGTRRSAS